MCIKCCGNTRGGAVITDTNCCMVSWTLERKMNSQALDWLRMGVEPLLDHLLAGELGQVISVL